MWELNLKRKNIGEILWFLWGKNPLKKQALNLKKLMQIPLPKSNQKKRQKNSRMELPLKKNIKSQKIKQNIQRFRKLKLKISSNLQSQKRDLKTIYFSKVRILKITFLALESIQMRKGWKILCILLKCFSRKNRKTNTKLKKEKTKVWEDFYKALPEKRESCLIRKL